MPTIALWIVWRLSADYLEVEKRVVGVALLMLIPFYNFHALKFNANSVLLPTWAATTLSFLRSYRNRSTQYGALAGAGAGLCMLAKYWSVFLLVGLLIAALADPRRFAYLRSAVPWVTIAAGFAVLGPHMIWLYQHDFVSFDYAIAMHVTGSFADAAGKALSYLVGAAAFTAVPVVFVLAAARPRRTVIAEMIWPSDRERRLVAVAFWAPLVLPIAEALLGGTLLSPIWSMPALTLLPVLLLSPPDVKILGDRPTGHRGGGRGGAVGDADRRTGDRIGHPPRGHNAAGRPWPLIGGRDRTRLAAGDLGTFALCRL